jgi:hypothetical protein
LLLVVGCDALVFEAPAGPPTYRVRLDVSGLAGEAWDAWCNEGTDALTADGIDPCGMGTDSLETWEVRGVASEEEAEARVQAHLVSGVTIHDVTEQ